MARRPLRAAAAALALIPFVAIGGSVQLALLKLGRPTQAIPLAFHRFALRAIGVRVRVIGRPAEARPLLMAANHASWLDIPVLGSTGPLSFVAKSEIAGWPVFGVMAKLQRTIFVDRSRRSATGAVNRAMAERMAAGEPVVLFAEGTSSDGNRVLPFRTALLGAAQGAILAAGGASVAVQPVSIAYTHRNGLPLGRLGRPFVAWYGDMSFAGHLMALLANGAVDVTVAFGEPLRADAVTDRKRLAVLVEREVRRMTNAALLGRGAPAAAAAEAERSGAAAPPVAVEAPGVA
ncbi:MAG TPA: lysophospholipid acyltransferase family protein [Hansschlegelia sp.]